MMVVENGIDVIILFNPWCTGENCDDWALLLSHYFSDHSHFFSHSFLHFSLFTPSPPTSPFPPSPSPPSHPIASTADTCHYRGPVGDLEEYILSTVGKIWIGTADSSYGRPWQHSQFMKDTLEVALSLLEKMKEDSFDPVKVSGAYRSEGRW